MIANNPLRESMLYQTLAIRAISISMGFAFFCRWLAAFLQYAE